MATELERLVVTLEASTKQYTNEIKKVRGETNRMFQAMQGEIAANSRRVESSFARMGSQAAKAFQNSFRSFRMLGGVAGGLVGGLGLNALIEGIRKIGDIGDTARDLSLSTDALQTFTKAMQLGGGSAEDMTKAIANMQNELTDTDSVLSHFLRDNNIDAAAMSTEQLFRAILKLSQALPAEDRLRLFRDGLKLRPGTALELAEAATHIEEAGKAARYSAEQIQKFDQFSEALGQGFQDAGVAFGDFLAKVLETDDSAEGIRKLVETFKEFLDLLLQVKKAYVDFTTSIVGTAAVIDFDKPLKDLTHILDLLNRLGAWITGSTPAQIKNLFSGIQPGFGSPGIGSNAGALAAIAQAEGTAGRGDYNAVLGYGKYGGAGANLVTMTLDQVYALGRVIKGNYEQQTGIVPGSSAVGRYQIVGSTMRGLQSQLGLPGSTLFSPEVQDMMAKQLLLQTMGDPAKMRSMWQGFSGFSDASLRQIYSRGPYAAPGAAAPATAAPPTTTAQPGSVVAPKTAEQIRDEAAAYKETEDIIKDLTKAQIALNAASAARQQQQVIEALKQANDALAASTETFITQLLDGASASDALRTALRQLAQQMLHMAIQGLFSAGGAQGGLLGALLGGTATTAPRVPGFASGGSFQVGGSGGTDSRMVAFRATPGEFVDISSSGMRRGRGGGSSISMGGIAIHVAGSADERTLAIMERRLSQAQAKQMQDIQRNWGVMTSRYQSHRGP